MRIDRDRFRSVGEMVTGWGRCLLLTHERPDGDALGSVVAMRRMLQGRGVDARVALFDDVPPRYAFVVDGEDLGVWGDDAGTLDGVIVMDTCSYNQLSPAAAWLRECGVPIVAMDHHVTRDDLATELLVDESASAACVILYEWSGACEWSLDAKAREALFVGIATDTGWFRHSNTDALTLSIASELVDAGVDASEVYRRLYLSDSAARVRLFARVMSGMELHLEDRLAMLCVMDDDYRACGAIPADTEDLVNEPLKIACVDVSVQLAESSGGIVKMSFRAKGDVNVAEVAAVFGGGGHAKAAGARIAGTMDEVKVKVLRALGSIIQGDSSIMQGDK